MGLVNEIGKVYGKLTVIERAPNDKAGRAYWLCQCECGNKTVVRGTSLRAGVVHSCGCLQKETAKANGNNLIGQTFGRLTVLEQVKNRTAHRGKYWKCQCACGNITEVRGDYLTGGTTKSCGCLQKEKAGNNKINEIGNQYGLLTVIAPYESDEQGHARWLCKCQCGNTKVCYGQRLRAGSNLSCGCLNSYAEMTIKQLLEQRNIEHEPQYTFDDLKGKAGWALRFDFAIFKNHKLFCLIEYQGEQHYDKTNIWYSQTQIENDDLKRKYCQEHNIPLLYCDKSTDLNSFLDNLIGSD